MSLTIEQSLELQQMILNPDDYRYKHNRSRFNNEIKIRSAATSTIPTTGKTVLYQTSESRFRRQQQENIRKTLELQQRILGNEY